MDSIFANDIRKGLTALHKYIPDRQYYDDRGSVYFQELMAHPDYHVTMGELSIFKTHRKTICKLFRENAQTINIIEFGAGDALKTKILLSECNAQIKTHYIAIDFSRKYLDDMSVDFAEHLPDIDLRTIHADYFDALESLQHIPDTKSIVFFIGSSLGGLSAKETTAFFSRLSQWMHKGDMLFVGLDLKKAPAVFYKAYHHTCKNWCHYLLQRINNELDANFDLGKFEYYTTYNPEDGTFKWFFISKELQSVKIEKLNLTIDFEEGEPINIGQSRKFSKTDIQTIANTYSFDEPVLFFDKHRLFTDALFQKK